MSTDLSLQGEELPPFEAVPGAAPTPSAAGAPSEPSEEGEPAPARVGSASVELDLSIVLDDIEKPTPITVAAPPSPGPIAGGDLDGVFAQLRDEASRRSTTAADEFKRGLALFNAGQIDECIPVLEAASKAPRLRFATAAILARIFQERGLMPQAVEWFERAAEAPAPNGDEGHRVLYELADALEATGESARALAIYIELQSEAGDYRDVAARVDRLAKVQSRG
jgi:hypothetical protein